MIKVGLDDLMIKVGIRIKRKKQVVNIKVLHY